MVLSIDWFMQMLSSKSPTQTDDNTQLIPRNPRLSNIGWPWPVYDCFHLLKVDFNSFFGNHMPLLPLTKPHTSLACDKVGAPLKSAI